MSSATYLPFACNGHIQKKYFFNYGAELQINKATMVDSFDRCLSYILSGVLAEVFIRVK